ncbi:helix-turn-helix domain-containing protein [Rufibacter latericius]|uniref:XRE family transcriptional regulator n=1 Tax=Rufibacter latericius TaxID=2487040 RepID=A0A3M9MAM0_9BACT|nr:helix-turn-helix transcriptional regulator [Rufibacter latericius]RNI22620.1 XRE family transcriptional regulator [Rufibacter latericius]
MTRLRVVVVLFSTAFLAVKNPKVLQAFGKRLRQLRLEKNLTQTELADAIDVARSSIQRIEGAEFAVTLDVLVSLANALKISLPELLNFEAPD